MAVLPVDSRAEGGWGSTNANSVVPIKRKHIQLDWLLGQKEHNESGR